MPSSNSFEEQPKKWLNPNYEARRQFDPDSRGV
jgi:hypothetical protein